MKTLLKTISKRAMTWNAPQAISGVDFSKSYMEHHVDLNVKIGDKEAVAHLTLAQAMALRSLLDMEIRNAHEIKKVG
jgi:hypothetical protein